MSSTNFTDVKDLGRAIAQGVVQENAQKERNMAKAEKRRETILRNQAEQFLH